MIDFLLPTGKGQIVSRILLATVAYCVSLWVTSHAYHVRNAYEVLPAFNDLVLLGLGWALVITVPSLVAIFLRKSNISGALLIGTAASLLSLVFLAPLNLGLIVLLSIE